MTTNSKEVQRRADEKRAGKRARAWTAILYPDSAPSNWRELLVDWCIDYLISPLHDRDVLNTGMPKKPHYHVIIAFDSAISRASAKEIFDSIGAVMAPERDGYGRDKSRVLSLQKSARYLCHLNNPQKAQYDINEVITSADIDYRALIMSEEEESALLDEIEVFIEKNNIVSLVTLQKYAREYRPDWKPILRRKYAYYVRELCKANQWRIFNQSLLDSVEFRDADGTKVFDFENSGWEVDERSESHYDPPTQSSKFQA